MRAGEPTRWGWHQLDREWARRLVAESGTRRGDLVLDIGAGTGAVTQELLAAGARVIAIELHPDRAERLRARFARQPVTVVRADAADLRLPRRPFRVVANPPFAITTAVLRRLLSPGSRLTQADLIVPTPIARRWARGVAPGCARWRDEYGVEIRTTVPATAFHPPAPRSASIVQIDRRA